MGELLLSTDIDQLVTWATYLVVALFVLVQWFLSLRPWFIWGLVMPLMFGGLWLVVLNPPEFLPSELGDILLLGSEAYILIAKAGIIVSLAIFLICRLVMLIRAQNKARRRRRRAEEKRQRQMREAAVLANSEPYNVAPQPKSPFGDVEFGVAEVAKE